MKLDKIRFSEVVRYISGLRPEYDLDVSQLDALIDIDIPAAPPVSIAVVDELVQAVATMNKDGGMIPAIKAYRALTGCTLLEGKTAIEKHRSYEIKLSKQEMYKKLNQSYTPDIDHNCIARFIDECF